MAQGPKSGLHGAIRLEGRVALFGGSFDPPHIGHQMALLYLLEGLGASCVWLFPTYEHALDKKLSSFEGRLEMCRRLASPFADRVSVLDDERELNAGGKTLALLEHLDTCHPDRDFALVVGQDILQERHRWHRWQAIEDRVPIVVLSRPGYDGAYAGAIELPAVSSSELREDFRHRRDVTGRVPVSVAAYVDEHDYYGGTR